MAEVFTIIFVLAVVWVLIIAFAIGTIKVWQHFFPEY